MTLWTTTNTITGRRTYFIDGKRVPKEAFELVEIRADMDGARVSNIGTTRGTGFVRHSKTIDFPRVTLC